MVKTYENAALFLKEAKDRLLERESVSQLVLGNAVSAGDQPCRSDLLFGTVWVEEELILAFCNCSPWNLVIHSVWQRENGVQSSKTPARWGTADEKIARASKELADYLKENAIPLNGVNANGFVCQNFLENYCNDGRIAGKELSMDIMECTALCSIVLQEGIYRSAAPEDAEWILEGCLAFEQEALGTQGDREKLLENILDHQIKENRLRLFCLPDNTPICMANRARDLTNGFSINQVYTIPEYRGRGYGQTLIYKFCEEYFRDGYSFATLFVDQTNPISNRVYAKVGFEIVEDNFAYHFTEAEKNAE